MNILRACLIWIVLITPLQAGAWSLCHITVNTLLYDSFTRSDNASLGANWTTEGGWGNPKITSNSAAAYGAGTESDAYYSGGSYSWTQSQSSQVDITTLPTSTAGDDCGIGTNYSTSANTTGNFCAIQKNAAGGTNDYNFSAGSITTTQEEWTLTPVNVTAPITIKGIQNGNVINCYINGTLIIQDSGMLATSTGKAGIGGGDGAFRMKNWYGGNWTGGAISPGFPTTSVLDNFNRTNGTLGGSWVDASGTGYAPMAIVSTTLIAGTNASDINGDILSTTYGTDHQAFMDITTLGDIGLGIRLSTTNWSTTTGYLLEYVNQTLVFSKFAAGTPTAIGYPIQFVGPQNLFTTADAIGIKAVGSTFYAYRRIGGTTWNLIGSWTDSTYASGTHIGVFTVSDTTARMDNFGGGNN